MRGERISKRGMIWSLVVYSVVFLVFLLFVIVLLDKFGVKWGEDFNTRDTCRLSAQAHAMTQVRADNVAMTPSAIDFSCPRRLVSIGEHNIEVNSDKFTFFDGRTNKTVKTYPAVTPEVVDSIVADEMAGCWYQFLEGKNDLFGNEVRLTDIFNNQRQCAICSEITFDKKVTGVGARSSPSYLQAIHDIKIRPKYSPLNLSLYNYIFRPETLCNPKFTGGKTDQNCIENYMHLYAFDYETDSWTKMLSKATAMAGAGGFAAAHRPFMQSIAFKPGKRYAVVFMREGGSYFASHWDQMKSRVGYIAGPLGMIFSEIYAYNNPTPTSQVSTYFVWVVDADVLSSDYCDGYFAG